MKGGTPIAELKEWHRDKPVHFTKRPYHNTGSDSYSRKSFFSAWLFFLYLQVAFSGMLSAAELSWDVEVEKSSPSRWTVVGGPENFSEVPESLKAVQESITQLTGETIERQERYGFLYSKLVTDLRFRFPGENVVVEPFRATPIDGRVRMRVVIPQKIITSVTLRLATARAASGAAIWRRSTSLADLATSDRYRLRLGPSRERVLSWGDRLSYQYGYTEEDVAQLAARLPADFELSPEAELQRQLDMMAAMVLSRFPAQKLVPGEASDSTEVQSAADVTQNMVFGPRGSVDSDFANDGSLDVLMTLAPFPSRVDIKVQGETTESEALAEELRRDYLRAGPNALIVSPFRYPDIAALISDKNHLFRNIDVASVSLDENDDEILFVVQPHPRVSRQVVLKGAVKVNPTDGASGTLSLELADAPGMPERVQRLSFTLEAGERVTLGEGDIVVGLSQTPGGGGGARLAAFFTASSLENNEVYYGNQAGRSFEEQRDTAEAGLRWSRDSLTYRQRFAAENQFVANGGTSRWIMQVDAGLRFVDVELNGNAEDLVGLNDGRSVGPYLIGDFQRTGFNPQSQLGAGLRSVVWESHVELDGGMSAWGSAGDYVRAVAATGLRYDLGLAEDVLGYARVSATGGWASEDTPTYALIGAGGPRFIRGLRQDEFIGREYVGLQGEFGVNLFDLWARFGGMADADAEDTTEATIARPLQNLYGSLLVDVGWLSERIVDGSEDATTQRLEGYGVLLAIRQEDDLRATQEFAIGYGYSPQSDLDQFGTIFTQINFRF